MNKSRKMLGGIMLAIVLFAGVAYGAVQWRTCNILGSGIWSDGSVAIILQHPDFPQLEGFPTNTAALLYRPQYVTDTVLVNQTLAAVLNGIGNGQFVLIDCDAPASSFPYINYGTVDVQGGPYILNSDT